MSSDKSDEFSLEGLEDIDLDELGENTDFSLTEDEDGFELDLSADAEDFSLAEEGDEVVENQPDPNEFSLTSVNINLSLSSGDDDLNEEVSPGELDLSLTSEDEIDLGDELKEEFSLGEELSDDSFNLDSGEDESLDDFSLVDEPELPDEGLEGFSDPLKDYSSPQIQLDSEDLTEDVRAKLKEIDAIMEEDATNAGLHFQSESLEEDDEEIKFTDDESQGEDFSFDGEDIQELSDEDMFTSQEHNEEESLVGDLNLSEFDLSTDEDESEVEEEEVPVVQAPPKKRKRKEKEAGTSKSFDDISQAYTGEIERTQATIANLRADREELLKRIDHLEEEKLLGHRNSLTLRAELDEKKIELTILRKKLNEEINELKDNIRIFEEKVLILEEKNKYLQQELETAGQKNKIDLKRVMLRERELEQKLELLKEDAETQIRNRDLKILELKRKIDGMEFDMESISQQEKKTLESRFELEDKLDKAIRTLRTAISTLEEDGDRSSTLEAIKKNIEM